MKTNVSMQIYDLRKEGKLEEACALALQNMKDEPDNITPTCDYGWVLYDMLNSAIDNDRREQILNSIEEFVKICDKCDARIKEAMGWRLVKLGFKIYRKEVNEFISGSKVISYLRKLDYPRPSELHSAVMNLIILLNDDTIDWIDTMKWWDLRNFRQQDYIGQQKDDAKFLSLAEKVITKLYHCMIQGNPGTTCATTEDILTFIRFLEDVAGNCPGYRFVPYYLVRLKLKVGLKEPMMPSFKQFALNKQSEFWVWSTMAEFPEFSENEKLACYCKALLCNKGGEDYVVKIRQAVIPLLLKKECLSVAAINVRKIEETCRRNGWELPAIIADYQKKDWFKTVADETDEHVFYNRYGSLAMKLLYREEDLLTGIVTGVDHTAGKIYFMVSREIRGSYKWNGHDGFPETGDAIEVCLDKTEDTDTGIYKAVYLGLTEKEPAEGILHEVEGKVAVREGNSFGFIGDNFVPEEVIKTYGLINGDNVKVRAIASYDNKKARWGWKVIKVLK